MFCLCFLIISGLELPIESFLVLPAELGRSKELQGSWWKGWGVYAGTWAVAEGEEGQQIWHNCCNSLRPKTGAELVCEHRLSFKDDEPVGEVPRARSSNRTVRKQQPPAALSCIRNLSNKRLPDTNDPGRARVCTGTLLCSVGPRVCLPFHYREMFLEVALQPLLVC